METLPPAGFPGVELGLLLDALPPPVLPGVELGLLLDTLPPTGLPVVELGLILDAIPPAGLPGVELGLVFDKQLLSLFPCAATVYVTAPPVPLPRASPPMSRYVVPARRSIINENPVPILGSTVIKPCMAYDRDCPPGMIPKKFGVLRESQTCYTKIKYKACSETHPCTVVGSHHIRTSWHSTS